MKIRGLYTLIMMMFVSLSISGRNVSLRVLCKETKSPLQAIVKIDASSGYADSVMCGINGKASIEIPDSISDAIAEISCTNRYPVIINIPNLRNVDLGIVLLDEQPVALNEFVVYGENHTIKAGKHSLIPSTQQVARNFNTAQLLVDLKSEAPELDIDLSRNLVRINGMAVSFQVNGRTQPIDRLIDLSPDRIARIEYTNYRDVRYEAPILNIILKPAPMGGSVSLYTNDAITTPKANAKVNGTYNYRKSEFLFDYNFTYRNSKEEISSEKNDYIAPDFQISRTGTGLPSSTRDQDHRFMAEYSFVPNSNSILVLSAQATLHRNRNNQGITYKQHNSEDHKETEYDSWNRRHYWSTPFSFGAFYKHKEGRRVLELSSSISRSNSKYGRRLTYSDGYDFHSRSVNDGTSAKVSADYQTPMRENLGINIGANYIYNESSSDLIQDEASESNSRLTKHEIYAYGKLEWQNRGFAISGGPGIRYVSLGSEHNQEKFLRWRGALSASQQVGRKFNISYSLTIDPFFPSRANYSTIIQRINDYSVQTGNPSVSSGMNIDQRIRFNVKLNNFRISPYVNYSYSHKPILEQWTYSPAENYFICSVDNGKYSQVLNTGIDFSLVNLLQKINITTYVGVNSFWVESPECYISKTSAFWGINASGYFGPCSVNIRFDPINEYQYQGAAYSKNGSFNNITINYTYKNFQFGLTCQNMFMHKARMSQRWSISNIHPSYSDYYIKNFNNCILLSVQYRIGMGERLKKLGISTNKVSTSDVIKAY